MSAACRFERMELGTGAGGFPVAITCLICHPATLNTSSVDASSTQLPKNTTLLLLQQESLATASPIRKLQQRLLV
uniref:Uncharacterized protein n=1 Tax=Setaria italica TaxID=4555 RepID=K4AHK0_SETIT